MPFGDVGTTWRRISYTISLEMYTLGHLCSLFMSSMKISEAKKNFIDQKLLCNFYAGALTFIFVSSCWNFQLSLLNVQKLILRNDNIFVCLLNVKILGGSNFVTGSEFRKIRAFEHVI